MLMFSLNIIGRTMNDTSELIFAWIFSLELKRCFERNYLEVMNLIEKTMSGDFHSETFKRPTSARDSYSPMVPQKLISSPSNGHSTASHSNNNSNKDLSNSNSLSQHAIFYRLGNPNSVRESTANSSINFGPTERLELPGSTSVLGVSSGHVIGMSTPAAVQFYSAGTTPSEETETAPFASRESFEQEEGN